MLSIFENKTKWVHIEFDARDIDKIYEQDYLNMRDLLKWFYLKTYHYVSKRFYLFEPNPFCFLALELKHWSFADEIEKLCYGKYLSLGKDYHFLKAIRLKKNTTDADNGEGFLIVLDAFTTFNLFYNDAALSHVIHCAVNNSYMMPNQERQFYSMMKKSYGA